MKNALVINFEKNQIVMTRQFAKKCTDTRSPEYAHLQSVRRDYPEYEVITRQIKKNSNKKVYKGLTYEYMRDYIILHTAPEEEAAALAEFDEMILISKCQKQSLRYPTIKSWFFTNEIKITLKSKKAATNALEILRTRLAAGFDCDKTYKKNPSEQMAQAFFVKGKSIVLPEEFGCLAPEDAESVQFELLQNLAENLNEDFSCKIYNYSDCSEAEITAKYQDGTLSIKSTYYPNGYCEYLCCEECGEDVVRIGRYKEGKIYICPECGEEIDLSEAYEENKPEIVEKIIKIK